MTRKEKIYAFINTDKYVPLMGKELAAVLDVPPSDMAEFQNILRELTEEGKIVKSRRGRYMTARENGLIAGKYQGSERGFGFVTAEGEETDYFVSSDNTGGAMNGDSVVIKVINKATEDRRAEAQIVKVTDRANKTIVCTMKRRFKKCCAIPDNKRIWQYVQINPAHTMGAENGQKVMVENTAYPKKGGDAMWKVTEILGWANDPATSQLCVIKSFGLPEKFSDEVIGELENIPTEVDEAEIKNRRDKRNETVITIDGADARDLDDAVSVKILENGNYLLSVHIADVSHYVKEGTAIFDEAVERGTSIYLAGGVIPMLPPKLSNGICSLNENVTRLTLSIDMEITPKGEIISHDIYNGVIKTAHRMTYTDVAAILKGNCRQRKTYADIVPMLKDMKKLAEILRKRRHGEGSIDFNFPETKLEFDETGRTIDVYPYEYTIANIIIEEFMLAANRTVAERFYWQSTPFVYRIHEQPSADKMTELLRILSVFGIKLKGKPENIHPKELQKVLEEIKDKPYERVVGTIMLRSMMKARYSVENEGHFGLSAKYYCHFTSPIRRLADLAIHRIIKASIDGMDCSKYQAFSAVAAENATDREILAEEAERTSKKLKIAEYVRDFIGMECEGVISSITKSGFYVELPNTVEGRVALSDMADDYYNFIPGSYSLRGERTGKTYNIGDSIKIIISGANTVTGDIDFVPADEEVFG